MQTGYVSMNAWRIGLDTSSMVGEVTCYIGTASTHTKLQDV